METKWDKPGKDAADKGKGKSNDKKNKKKDVYLEQDWEVKTEMHEEDFDGDGSSDFQVLSTTTVNGNLIHEVRVRWYAMPDDAIQTIKDSFARTGLTDGATEKYTTFRQVLKNWQKGIKGLRHLNDSGFEQADKNKLP